MTHLFGSHFGTYEVDTEDGRPVLNPFRLDRDPSPVGRAFLDLADHPDRVLVPVVRQGWLDERRDGDPRHRSRRGRDGFVPLGWDDAAAMVAGEVDRVRMAHGNRAIFGGSYGWASAGRFHHAQSQLKRFLNMAGGFTSAVNTYSYGTASVLLSHVLGPEHREAGVVAPSWDQVAAHTDHLVSFGGLRMSNAQVEAGGTGSHRVRRWLGRALARGMRLTVLSPTRADVPDGGAARYVPIRPNTDAAVLLAMAWVLLDEGMEDARFLRRCTAGADEFAAYLRGAADGQPKSPSWAEAISGVPAAMIRELAVSAARENTLVNLAWSLQRARFGEQPFWAAVALMAVAGTVGQPGRGFAFGLSAVNSVGQPVRRLRGQAVPQGVNPVKDFIPVAAVSELLLRPGGTLDYDGQVLVLPDIRLVFWAGGNPFHHHQDLHRLAEAFRRPETVVVNECMWTATARHADIVLPATFPFERDDLAVSSRDNWLVASRTVRPPPPGPKSDHAIMAAVARPLGLADRFTDGMSEMEWLEQLYNGYRATYPELPAFEAFWEAGHAALDLSDEAPHPYTPFAAFVADPASHPLSTPSGRIEVASATVASFGYHDCPGHPAWLPPEEWLGAPLAACHPFHLISPQPARRLHSQLEKAGPSQQSKLAGYEPIRMCVADATRLGIQPGDVVEVWNDRGSIYAAAVPTPDVCASVVVLETGAWFRPVDRGGRVTDEGGNPNTLTADRRSSRLSQGCAPNSVLVSLRKVA